MGSFYRWGLITPDNSKIITEMGGPFEKSYVVRDTKSNKLITTINAGNNADLCNAAFSPDGYYFAMQTGQHPAISLSVWSLDTGKRISELMIGETNPSSIIFSPDGKTIACSLSKYVNLTDGKSGIENMIALWNTDTDSARYITLKSQPALALAFTPDGHTLAAGVGTGVLLYGLQALQSSGSLPVVKSSISALRISNDATRIAVGCEDGSVLLWDMRTRKLLITMLGFQSFDGKSISKDWLAYTPTGHYYCSSGTASLIRWRYNGKSYAANAFAKELRREKLLK